MFWIIYWICVAIVAVILYYGVPCFIIKVAKLDDNKVRGFKSAIKSMDLDNDGKNGLIISYLAGTILGLIPVINVLVTLFCICVTAWFLIRILLLGDSLEDIFK